MKTLIHDAAEDLAQAQDYDDYVSILTKLCEESVRRAVLINNKQELYGDLNPSEVVTFVMGDQLGTPPPFRSLEDIADATKVCAERDALAAKLATAMKLLREIHACGPSTQLGKTHSETIEYLIESFASSPPLRPETEDRRDVHTEHCCEEHRQCKYGNVYCPVATGKKHASYPCNCEHM